MDLLGSCWGDVLFKEKSVGSLLWTLLFCRFLFSDDGTESWIFHNVFLCCF